MGQTTLEALKAEYNAELVRLRLQLQQETDHLEKLHKDWARMAEARFLRPHVKAVERLKAAAVPGPDSISVSQADLRVVLEALSTAEQDAWLRGYDEGLGDSGK